MVPELGTKNSSTTTGTGNASFAIFGQTHGLRGQVAEKAGAEQEFVPPTWGQGLKKIQARLEKQQQTNRQNLVQEDSKLTNEQQAWEKTFSAEVVSYERELCADVSRQDYEVCIRFRAEEQKNSEQMQQRLDSKDTKISEGVTAWAVDLQGMDHRLENDPHHGISAAAELQALQGRLEAQRAKK